jgi:acetyl esterase/lipase
MTKKLQRRENIRIVAGWLVLAVGIYLLITFVSYLFTWTVDQSLPPALVIVGGRDSLHNEGVLYYNMLMKNGVDAQLLDYPEGLHCFIYKKSNHGQDAIAQATAFLKKYLE